MRKYFLTDEQIARIIEIYPNTLTQDIADEFCVPILCIRNMAFKLKLKKSKQWVIETSRARSLDPNNGAQKTWFKKGIIPLNKGKKQHEYMCEEAIERTKHTRFKSGDTPPNKKEVGYERITEDGYIEIKTEYGFKLKHRVIWEQHFGFISKGMNIQFKDGNRQNLDINNLYLISRQMQLKEQNSIYARYPIEVRNIIHAKRQLTREINKRTLKNKEE